MINITIDCDSMAPLQDPLKTAFEALATAAGDLKLQALIVYGQAKKALQQGLTDLYNTLMSQYNTLLGVYDSFVGEIVDILDLINPFPLSASNQPLPSISCLTTMLEQKARGITTEYSAFLIQKFLGLIEPILPISLIVPLPFLGEVDIVELFTDPEYANTLKAQIAADIEGVLSAVPASVAKYYRGLMGGVSSLEYTVQEIWQWFMQQIATGGTKLLHDACSALIDKFKTIWNSFGFPALAALLTLDIEGLIDSAVESATSLYESTILAPAQSAYNTAKDAYQKGELDRTLYLAAGVALKNAVKGKWSSIINSILGITVFTVTVGDMVNIDPNLTMLSAEDIISSIISQAKDWATKYPLKLITDWMNVVKDFFSAIGLGALVDFITFTFCDFLELIGLPV